MLRLSPRTTEKIAFAIIWAGGIFALIILAFIIGYVLINGISEISWDFLFTRPRGGISGEGGISSCIVSTIYLIALTLVILILPGIGAAIYLAEYARDNRLTRLIRFGVDTLAGVPSIIFGLFGFVLFVTALGFNFSLLAGALTLACLLLPTLIRTAEEALKTVPRGDREAALSLGATKWQAIRYVILPAAFPGIITGIILCVGRALGETACLFVTVGSSVFTPQSPMDGGRPLALHVYYLMTDTNAWEKAMATATVLLVSIIIVNALTNWLSRRFQARMRGRK